MEKKHKIVFIGSSSLGLQKLLENTFFSVVGVLCLENRVNENLLEMATECGLTIKKFKWIKEFREIVNQYPLTMPFFIYQLDMLVPSDLTEKYGFYNVHRGDLYTNRGPTPDIWPILNGDKETSLSLHKINEKIDSGILIDAYSVPIGPSDDTISVKINQEVGLPQLIQSLEDFIKGIKKGIVLSEGHYRPWIKESDFTINLDIDTVAIIDRKIKSQRQYNGAILIYNNKKYYILDILKIEKRENDTGFSFEEYDNCIKVKSGSDILTLKENKTPRYLPPPKQQHVSKRI